MITSLYGIMIDLDPRLFREQLTWPLSPSDPISLYENLIHPMLLRDPVLRRAEVRLSGQGLHVIIWFKEHIQFETEASRERWSAMVQVIQRMLPTDPDCPGITTLSRPIGSVNGKNNRLVQRLYEGEPVPVEDVEKLFRLIQAKPFRTIANVLFGGEHIIPCPICQADGSRLDALDKIGRCYGSCGNVRVGRLYDCFLSTRPADQRQK